MLIGDKPKGTAGVKRSWLGLLGISGLPTAVAGINQSDGNITTLRMRCSNSLAIVEAKMYG